MSALTLLFCEKRPSFCLQPDGCPDVAQDDPCGEVGANDARKSERRDHETARWRGLKAHVSMTRWKGSVRGGGGCGRGVGMGRSW